MSPRLKVLMPCWEYPPLLTGGLGVACAGLAGELAELVDLEVVESGEQVGGYEGDDLSDLGERVDRFTRKIVAASGDAGLVHAHDWMSFPAAMEIQSQRRIPFVAHIHSLEVDRSGPSGSSWIRDVETEGMKKADRVIVVSQYTARAAVDHYRVDPAKIRIVHNGVAAVKPWRAEVPSPCVLFMGRMTGQKSPDVFLEAAFQVAEKYPHVGFVMAGKGALLESLKRRAGQSEFGDRIEFPGFLERAAIRALLARATVCCMPSRSEPFGLVALEAAQFGVPTVLSSQAGVGEVLRSNPVVSVGDVDGFARHIVELLRDEVKRADLGRRLMDEASEATWRSAADKVVDVYRGVFS